MHGTVFLVAAVAKACVLSSRILAARQFLDLVNAQTRHARAPTLLHRASDTTLGLTRWDEKDFTPIGSSSRNLASRDKSFSDNALISFGALPMGKVTDFLLWSLNFTSMSSSTPS